ncbi:MAG: type II secretion system minor pseudopilin GspH [Gammaproteobacteria bacterium]|nr:type II secretion system minor pseudopilin GspH [Gammaproteobacteria bacterium]
MQTNVTAQITRQHGFTLLELLVVVVIVAILFTYTTLAIRSDSAEDIIKKEAHRMERLLQLALEETILRGEEYGIEVFTDGYRFLHFTENQWLPVNDDKILRARDLPLNMELEMRQEETGIEMDNAIDAYMSQSSDLENFMSDTTLGSDEDQPDDEQKNITKPQIYLLSSGEITPEFDIRFYILGVETSYIVKGLFDGTLTTEISEL